MQTKAAVLHQLSQPLRVETLELDAPGDDEVLVRMRGAGVCHSDWLMMTGVLEHPVPVVPGHEGAGIVEDVGIDVTRVRPGDHVVLDFIPRCGRCYYCSRGLDNLCPTYRDATWGGTMMDGTTRMSLNGERIHHWSALSCFSEWVVVACRSAGIDAIDGPFADFRDPEGYEREATRAMVLGCVGKWAIHPAQVEVAQRVYSPTQEEVDGARRLVQAYDQALARGEGAAQVDGVMIDAASVRIVQNTLDKAELYGM